MAAKKPNELFSVHRIDGAATAVEMCYMIARPVTQACNFAGACPLREAFRTILARSRSRFRLLLTQAIWCSLRAPRQIGE